MIRRKGSAMEESKVEIYGVKLELDNRSGYTDKKDIWNESAGKLCLNIRNGVYPNLTKDIQIEIKIKSLDHAVFLINLIKYKDIQGLVKEAL